jgi:HSP20 family protein
MATPAQRKSQEWMGDERGNRSNQMQRRSQEDNMPLSPVPYLRPLANFYSEMDRMFDNVFRNFGMPIANIASNMPEMLGMQNMFRPKVDIVKNEDVYKVTIEAPGIDERDMRLDISSDGTLTISGEKRQENIEDRQNLQFSECSYGTFQRTLTLPDDVDQEAVEARFRNGVLTIVCPRNREMSRSRIRQIPISSGGGREGREGREPREEMRQHNQPGGANPKKAA